MEVENRIKQGIAEMTDVVVHIDPEDDELAPPCKGLPLRDQALQQLREAWQDLGCVDQERRILLHYLSGKIRVEVFYPASCYEGAQATEAMRESMLQALEDRPYYTDVSLYFG